MPLFDVDDGFDPEMLDEVLVLRFPQNISGTNGRALPNRVAPIPIEAVVEALSGATTRDPDYQLGEKVIRVTTPFRLRGPTPGYEPDVVVVDTEYDAAEPFVERYAASPSSFDHYVVSDASDFSRYGQGFVTTTCRLTDAQPQPPTG